MRHSLFIISGVAILTVLLGGSAILVQQSRQWIGTTLDDGHFAFAYHRSLHLAPLTDDDYRDGILFRLTESETADEQLLITIRKETGLQGIAALAHQDPLDMLLANADRAYPLRYPGYVHGEQRRLTIDHTASAVIRFTYDGSTPDRIAVAQRIMVLGGTAYIITTQARAPDFLRHDRRYFRKFFESITIQ